MSLSLSVGDALGHTMSMLVSRFLEHAFLMGKLVISLLSTKTDLETDLLLQLPIKGALIYTVQGGL